MKMNKLDKNIREKFENRTFEPSASAWDRLSLQLDQHPKQKKFGWFFYISIAASILLLVSIGIQIFSDDVYKIKPKEEVVILPIDENKIDNLNNDIPVPEIIVKKDEVIAKKDIIHAPVIAENKKKSTTNLIDRNITINKHALFQVDKIKANSENNVAELKKRDSLKTFLKQDPNSTIKINADDLLYAVTHTSNEVKAYYAKYNVNREDVFRTIKSELNKSNLKVNPNTILAEVERNINDEFFENNFMKSLKRRVSDIATVIASRND